MSKKNKEQTDPIQDNPEAQNIQEPQVQEPTVVPSSEELMEQEKDRYLRLFADFENYKRRTRRSVSSCLRRRVKTL